MLLVRPQPLAFRGGRAFAVGAIFLVGLAAGAAIGPIGARSSGTYMDTSAPLQTVTRGSH